LLAEFAPGAVVWLADAAKPSEVREFTVAELIPEAFAKFIPGKSSRGRSTRMRR
jgi:hypothetical protein